MKDMQTTLGNLAPLFAWGYPGQDPHDAYLDALTGIYDELYEKGYYEYKTLFGSDRIAKVVGIPSREATVQQMEETEIEVLSNLIEA